MHSLETLERLNLEASERELSREYGRERVRHDAVPPRYGGACWRSPDRLRTLRARLLALGAALLALSCSSPVRPREPQIAGPCAGPVLVPIAVRLTATGDLDAVLYRAVH